MQKRKYTVINKLFKSDALQVLINKVYDGTFTEFVDDWKWIFSFSKRYRPMQSCTMEVKKKGLFKTLQEAGVENCAVFKKHRILRPFAWIYQIFRYILRGIKVLFKGEKLKGDITAGKEQFDFFNRLGLK